MANPKRASLAELLASTQPDEAGQGGTAPETEAREASAPRKGQGAEPEKTPADFARVGLYLHPAVAKEIKLVAFTHDRKAHDIYLEAVDLVLKKYGRRSIKELSAKV